MSGKNALAFVAGLGSGYLSAQQRGRDQERQDKQDAWQTEQQDWQRQEQQQKTSLRRGLADATAPATVNESGATLGLADGTKTVYDSADVAGSDFRQLRRADEATGSQTLARATLADGKNLQPAAEPPAPVGLASSLNSGLPEPDPAQSVPTSVGLASGRDPTVAQAPQKAVTMNGKAFGSTANAKVAADAYNAPEARAGRMAAVYDAHGASDKALDLTVNSMKLGEMKQAVADKAVVRRIGALQTPEEVAKFISDYPHDGQGGELKTEAVRSADGKTWGMVVVKSDGTRQPIPGDFTNDADGMTQAHITLLSKLNPEKRIEMYKWEKETDRKLKADANTARHQGEMEKTARIAAEAAQARAQAEATGKAPPGFRKTADGNLEAIPGGPADKTVASGKPLNDAQSKALLFGSRMRDADKIVDGLAVEGTNTSVPGSRGALGGVMNPAMPESKQRLDQAKRDFVNAVLRRESGAVIADSEFANAEQQYFPQIGDSAKVIEQKSKNRKLALDGILLEVPEAHRNSLQPRAPRETQTPKTKSVSIGGKATEARLAPDGKYYVTLPNGRFAEVRN